LDYTIYSRVVPFIDYARWDVPALASAWRAARPFPHVILDELTPPERVAELRAAIAREPHWPNRGDFYEMMASADPPAHESLRAFAAELARAPIAALTGKTVTRLELRSYVYLPGAYLLPHSDCRADQRRAVAFAYYLSNAADVRGGELEFFDCKVDGDEIIETPSAKLIAPEANRLVLFEVSLQSLHQVREVTSGGRVSLSGWFYP
jgi:hypothetical protein